MIECTCPVCQTRYQADPGRLKLGRQTTCSRKCSYALRAANLSNSTTQPCAVCGTPTTRSPSQQRSKAKVFLCSPKCHYLARSMGIVGREVTQPYNIPEDTRIQAADRIRELNRVRALEGRYKHSDTARQRISLASTKRSVLRVPKRRGWVKGMMPEEVRRKIALGVAKAIAEGRIPRVSKLEYIVKQELEALGLAFVHQKVFRDEQGRFAALPDFYLPDLNLVLEVNGTFWHADPREFPAGPQHPSQYRTQEKYRNKMRHLAQLGIPVVEVWEADIRVNPRQAVERALIPRTGNPPG